MELPHVLIEQIREGAILLFLGCGASRGASHPQGATLPDGQQVADLLAKRFLGSAYVGRPLEQVAALATSEADIVAVQTFIADLFSDFRPAAFHKLIPTFVWSAIATTSYDLIVERSYDGTPNRCQTLEPFLKNGQRIEERLRNPSSVALLKLHGCITKVDDPEVPIILTPEQYVTHRRGRSRLFERLVSLAYEMPILFVGHSLADIDLRMVLLELGASGASMPRSYIVAPKIEEAEERYWASKKVTCIKATFEDFLKTADTAIPRTLRKLAVKSAPSSPHPIARWLRIAPDAKLSERLSAFLATDVEYVHRSLSTETPAPKLFYKGYSSDWSPIVSNLDARRSITDRILSEVVLPTEEERATRQELVVLKGHAGSGKTVALRRLAWEAATEFERLCLFVRSSSRLDYESLFELQRLSGERIFIFFDSVSDHKENVQVILARARRDRLPLTLIAGERQNEWNVYCEMLEPYVSRFYDLRYLNGNEIDALLTLLERHRSLGHLESLSVADRHSALEEKAGRNLLVALHEATMGMPFSDIILDEYNSIPDEQAKVLYRTVCILHRLNVATRAGLLARVHGILFSMFKERLFKPLEVVVFAQRDDASRDYAYRSRHPHIADIVFERVLTDASDRFDEYIRIISVLDVDFEADRAALRGLANGRELRRLFPDQEMVRKIFAAAKDRDPTNPMVLQQEAIFEMNSGDAERATALLLKARAMRPWHSGIEHSLAELSLKKATASRHHLEKAKHRAEARSIAIGIINRGSLSSRPYHTLLKLGIEELAEAISESADYADVGPRIRDVEKLLADASQAFPGDSFILDAEAQLSELLNRNPRALDALKRAFLANKQSPYIATRLSHMQERAGNIDAAISVLKECLDANCTDKDIHFRLGRLLVDSVGASDATARYHLRNSFVSGDSRYEAQFWFARSEYLSGNTSMSMSMFKELAEADVPSYEKQRRRGRVDHTRFRGVVDRIDYGYAFVLKDGDASRVFVSKNDTGNGDVWSLLERRMRVSFELAFNYYGPVGLDVRRER